MDKFAASLVPLLFVMACSISAAQNPAQVLSVAKPLDETGQGLSQAALMGLRSAVAAQLRADGFSIRAGSLWQPRIEVRPQVIQCPAEYSDARGVEGDRRCLGLVSVAKPPYRQVAFARVVATRPDARLADLGAAMARAVIAGLDPRPTPTKRPEQDITAAGAHVRHLGDGRFAIGNAVVDLRAVRHDYHPVTDPDVPAATDVTLDDLVPADRREATITLYQVDPPLTGLPSREPGVDRGTDFRTPADLVKAAYTNYVSPVLTDDPVPVRVASHPIGHFFVKVEAPGYPTLLTGMTTVARADTELVDMTVGRRLGIGGVLLTPQPGRLNSAAEVVRELALRQRPLRVIDGLYFHSIGGRNTGPEYRFEDGRVVFARVKVPVINATDALAYFVEFIHRRQENRFGSLLNRPFKGTGAGCAAFAMSWLQAAGAIPFITEPTPGRAVPEIERLGPTEFWRAVHANVHIPWRELGCDERVGAARAFPAGLTIYDLLFHQESRDFILQASEGVAERIRASYGAVAATLFQFGALTPVRDLVIGAKREDPEDRGDYTWNGPGIDVVYWDNSRFAVWIRRLWEKGPKDPRITLVREGRFIGVEIDATSAPRQHEPFFATADNLNAKRAVATPGGQSCQEVFQRGLE